MASLKEVTKQVYKDLSKVDKLPRFIGAALHSETLDRIFTKGIGASGSPLGIYAMKTREIKREKGRYSGPNVNLRDTDTLANSYTWNALGKTAEIGFANATRNGVTNTKLIPKLEKQYGDIFGLTKKEEKLVDDLTDDFINELF